MAITEWLEQLGLVQYAQAFTDNHITLDIVPDLTKDDLIEIGVKSIGHRRQILRAAEALRDGEGSAAAAHPAAAQTPEQTPTTGTPAERRQLTVMFCDLVGSTALAASLDPEEMTAVADLYQRTVAAEVQRIGGHIAEYLGDGIVSYFGYPRAQENEPERAVRTALAIVAAVGKLKGPDGKPLACRIGIATGLVVVGDLFHSVNQQRDNVVGDTPNLAARLQSAAQPNQIVIAPETRRQVGRLFELTSLGLLEVKGLRGSLEAWVVTGEAANEGRFRAMHDATPVVGRSPEINLLMSRWQGATKGHCEIALVSGEAGIGKSRVIEEVVSKVEEQGAAVHRFYCSSFHTSAAYYPIASYMERAAGIVHGDTPDGRLDKLDALIASLGMAAADVGALLAPVLSLPSGDRYPPPNMAPTAIKSATFAVLARMLFAASGGRPALIVIEDTHWADPTTREMIEYLADCASAEPVMLLAAFRPEDEASWQALNARATKLELSRLTAEGCEDVIRNLTGGKLLPQGVRDEILQKADGIPLFVEEITKTLLESDMLREQDGAYVLTVPMAALSVPSTLKDSLSSRLDRLSIVKEIAQIGSVIGRRFTGPMLAAVSGYTAEALAAALDALVEAEIVFRSGSSETSTYIFKHALIRDAAYESLLNARRIGLHARVAEVVEQQFPEILQSDPQLVATHLELAQQNEQAVPYWLRAGQQAMAAAAIVEATKHLGRGLALIDDVPSGQKRDELECELRTVLGLAHISLQGWQAPDVAEHLTPAYEIGSQLGQTDNLLMASYGLWIHWLNRADFAESQRWINRAKTDFGNIGSDDWGLLIPTMQVVQETWVGNFAGAEAQANQVRELYDPAKHGRFVYMFGNDPLVMAAGFQSWTTWLSGHFEKAERERLECERYSEAVNHPFDRSWQLMPGSLVTYHSGNEAAFSANVEKTLQIGEQQRIPFVQMLLGPIWVGLGHIMNQRWREAVEIMPGPIGGWRAMGGGVAIPFWEDEQATAHMHLGEFDQAKGLVSQAIAAAEQTGEVWYGPELYRIKGEILLAENAGAMAEAEQHFRKALTWAEDLGAHALAGRARQSLAEYGLTG
jgi:class 3 adenylate cyclase/tetratricopeptide (TPR) repeat protein